eukprot:CAMPEP_0198298582 /NCGR_PEP_ID=MMETSP1449-20131203/41356_1 /TAXON_ID=420275 /ORGANISM="Attheya septentrionalis, Strain CCMP2084" /LENGTH=524 /DNA_ID=CAMNT_0043999881 /DNA_START=121 /DNA_END=1695 /DNA_ORIENTATION=+
MKTFQSDGINLASGFVVERSKIVRQIISTAMSRQQIVVSSPPATGKTSLMTLVEAEILKHGPTSIGSPTNENTEEVEAEAVNIVIFREVYGGADTLRTIRKLVGIDDHGPVVVEQIRKAPPSWLIIDDAQSGYTSEYAAVWEFIIKDLKYNPGIKVIISATHTIITLGSPADISGLPHVFDNFSESEVAALIQEFCAIYREFERWEQYWDMVKELSLLHPQSQSQSDPGGNQPVPVPVRFHVGVVVKCISRLPDLRKHDYEGQQSPSPVGEVEALSGLRHRTFLSGLGRCFAVNEEMIRNPVVRASLTDGMLGDQIEGVTRMLEPFVRAGVLNKTGAFSCQAAHWFYNLIHFEGRPNEMPGSIELLVEQAVASLSASRLGGCVQDDLFPVETSFQHLLNETLTMHLPITASLKSEYRTKAQGFLGDTKYGFIDFYINEKVQWAIGLLRLGHTLKEHQNRFHPISGKYRELPTKGYLVIDIRGPKEGGTIVPPSDDLCVLYFSAQWNTCVIQMREMADKTVMLSL